MIRFFFFFFILASFPLETYSSKGANSLSNSSALGKILWEKELPGAVKAILFDVASDQIFVALEKKSASEIIAISKGGNETDRSAEVRGDIQKIFSYQGKVFVLTRNELISFDAKLRERKKVLEVKDSFDFVFLPDGSGVSAEAEGVFLWKRTNSSMSQSFVKEDKPLVARTLGPLFFDAFDLLGLASDGTVWNLASGKQEKNILPVGCWSVWKYDQSWICVKRDRLQWGKNSERKLPSKLTAFGFGYQREAKDSFWVFALEEQPNQVRAVSLPSDFMPAPLKGEKVSKPSDTR